MKRILVFFWVVLPICKALAQVGIGTTAPNARLDIEAANPTAPSNTDGVLIPRVSSIAATNPTAAQNGMLVFLTTTSGIRDPGFYFWDIGLNDWVKLSSALDNTWTDGGGYLYPTVTTHDVSIGHMGWSGSARLHILSQGKSYSIFNQIDDNAGSPTYGLYNILNAASGEVNGVYNFFSQNGTDHIGVHNAMGGFLGNKTGIRNFINGDGLLRGMSNEIFGSDIRGVYNSFSNSGIAFGAYSHFQPDNAFAQSYGYYSQFDGSDSAENYGTYNQFNNFSTANQYGHFNNFNSLGNGSHWGQFNFFNNSPGFNYGMQNEMYISGSNLATGVYNNITGGNVIYGVHNQLNSDGFGAIGIHNLITGSGQLSGSYTTFENAFAAQTVYGNYVNIQSSVSGGFNKYGFYSVIDQGADGTHYGIFSEALKPGSFSGYFVGDVRIIGTPIIGDFSNDYRLPTTDGAPGDVLQTDGIGQVSWSSNHIKPYVTTGTSTGLYFLDQSHYTVRVFNDISGVVLPAATDQPGRIFIIIGSNGISPKTLTTLGGIIYDDVTQSFINTINANQRFMLQSDGIDWIVIGN